MEEQALIKLYQTGLRNYWGTHVPINYEEASNNFRLAAEQGYPPAQVALGDIYQNGQGTSQDFTEAVNWHRRAAEQGDPKGQTRLGQAYAIGRGVPQNFARAAYWQHLAAVQGNSTAQNTFGTYCQNATGVDRNYQEAVRWYRMSAQQGNATAMSNLAACYEHGLGVSKNPYESMQWYRRAADPSQSSAEFSSQTKSDLKFRVADPNTPDPILNSSDLPTNDLTFSPANEPPEVEWVQWKLGKALFFSISLCSFIIGVFCIVPGIGGLTLDQMGKMHYCEGSPARTAGYSLLIVEAFLNFGFIFWFVAVFKEIFCHASQPIVLVVSKTHATSIMIAVVLFWLLLFVIYLLLLTNPSSCDDSNDTWPLYLVFVGTLLALFRIIPVTVFLEPTLRRSDETSCCDCCCCLGCRCCRDHSSPEVLV